MGGFNLQDLMSKAKAQADSLQKKMQETIVEASSGGGAINVKMDAQATSQPAYRPGGREIRRCRNASGSRLGRRQ